MRKYAIRSFVVAGTVVATLAGLGLSAGPVAADPVQPPLPTTNVGVGSETLDQVFDGLAVEYNAAKGADLVASWDAVGSPIIVTKGGPGSSRCRTTRPDGSNAGIEALNADVTGGISGGQVVYCIDFARSSRPPNTTTNEQGTPSRSGGVATQQRSAI